MRRKRLQRIIDRIEPNLTLAGFQLLSICGGLEFSTFWRLHSILCLCLSVCLSLSNTHSSIVDIWTELDLAAFSILPVCAHTRMIHLALCKKYYSRSRRCFCDACRPGGRRHVFQRSLQIRHEVYFLLVSYCVCNHLN